MRLSSKFNGIGTGRSVAEDNPPRRDETVEPAPSAAVRNLALAHYLDRLIKRGLIADYTQAARMLGVSQPRMTHLMGLLLLAPKIQDAILMGKVAPKDKELRELARVAEWQMQEASIRTTDV